MESAIEISGLKIWARHGVLPQERIVGNQYIVDATIYLDLTQAAKSDDLGDTINYAEVVSLIEEEMKQPSALLEHVAGRILHQIAQKFHKAQEAEIRIAKLSPPISAQIKSCAVYLRMKFSNDAKQL